MKKLTTEKRAAILRCLIEGNSILSTSRITGAAKASIIKFLAQAGEACAAYQSKTLRNLDSRVLQLDEVWSFVGCREKNKAEAVMPHPGDVWTWTAIDAETKLIPAFRVGDRSARTANDFCADLATRFSGELQITSDGHPAYRAAVGTHFENAHFAQLIKIYGQDDEGKDVCIGSRKEPVFGNPDMALVSTSYVERANLGIRMGNRRFTRLTNAFSKKLENHVHMLAIGFMHHNFSRKHQTLGTSPAVAAGVADHVWTMKEIVEMMDAYFEEQDAAQFERAFAEQAHTVRNWTPRRSTPKSYTPTPKDQIPVPWYLDPNGKEPNL